MYLIKYCVGSSFILLILAWPQLLWTVLLLAVLLAAVLLGVSGTITAHVMLSMKHPVRHVTILSTFSNFHKCLLESYNNHKHKSLKRLPVIFGRSVDIALQDLLELVVRDLISPWLEDLSFSSKNLQYSIK